MSTPTHFQRLYSERQGRPAFTGPEYPAQPHVVANVLKSMNDAAGGEVPFNVRFRMDDGSIAVVKPKGGR